MHQYFHFIDIMSSQILLKLNFIILGLVRLILAHGLGNLRRDAPRGSGLDITDNLNGTEL
jgi:hypothetical protein